MGAPRQLSGAPQARPLPQRCITERRPASPRHGTMARVFDCFVFARELDLLEIRLHELAPVVDIFVLAESRVTFQGNPKPLIFHENRQRFAQFADRIHHIVVPDMPGGTRNSDDWRRQRYQRNALMSGIADATPNDVVLLSDVDEIPRAETIRVIAENADRRPTVHCLELRMYKYFLNFYHREPWLRSGPRAIRRRFLRTMQGLRYVRPPTPGPMRSAARWLCACGHVRRPVRRVIWRDAGWHFSSVGGVDALARKLASNSAALPEHRHSPDRGPVEIATARILGAYRDPDLRKVPMDNSFPTYLRDNMARFGYLIGPD